MMEVTLYYLSNKKELNDFIEPFKIFYLIF